MKRSSNHQYPDSFESLSSRSSSGHIEHRNVDMDTHDRAVQRSAGRHAARKSSAPFWLLFCLLLFIALVVFFVRYIPSRFASPEQGTVPVTSEESTGTGTDIGDDSAPAPDEGANGSSLSEAAVVTVEETPTPTPAPTPTPEPTPEPVHIHSYRNGVCSVCGAVPTFYTGYLPEEYYQKCERAGTVMRHEYSVTAYANHGIGTYNKCFNIYLPYGYTDTKPYNVLVLVHGGGGDEDSWLNDEYESDGYIMCGRDIFDNLFDQGGCDPCIIIAPVTETPVCQGLTAGIYQLRDELREYILPYVAENYSTYAEDGSLESLRKARDHFGLGGLSNGALFVFEGGMRYNFDLFGSYAAFSGDGEPWKTVGIIQSDDYAELPINCLFTGAGTVGDNQQHYTEIGYDYFLEKEPRLTEGKNAWRVDVEGGHEWKVWFTDMVNALPLMFQSID